MISLELAQRLKKAGLVWKASNHHFFAIPDRELDDRVFVISDLMAHLDLFRGWPVVTFHGAVEWALDYILTTNVVWMPTEEQLREELAAFLSVANTPFLQLNWLNGHYCCEIDFDEQRHQFEAQTASEAYGQALLFVLQQSLE